MEASGFALVPGASNKRKRSDVIPPDGQTRWKYKLETEEERAKKKALTRDLKRDKERRRRHQIATEVNELRDLLPQCHGRKVNQPEVMACAADYIGALVEAVHALRDENRKFREDYAARELPLPVPPTEIPLPTMLPGRHSPRDRNAPQSPSAMDIDNPYSPPDTPTPYSSPATLVAPVPNLLTDAAGQYVMTAAVASPSSPSSSHTLSLPSSPIAIPGTVGAPIRPHESRTRLERAVGSEEHLKNKNVSRKKNEIENSFVPVPVKFEDPLDSDRPAQGSFDFQMAMGMHLDVDELQISSVNDIEEVGEWPLYAPSCNDPLCSNFPESLPGSRPVSASSRVPSLSPSPFYSSSSSFASLNALHGAHHHHSNNSSYNGGMATQGFRGPAAFTMGASPMSLMDSPDALLRMSQHSVSSYINPFI